ncbi:cation:proton antiporter [Corynebacterium kroppenstedtii]|uniref:cation:proton antiporter n=1 Tax=Corynebacterium sp. PCR 32 TaxID=3351342 RepID=UPI0030AAF945
MAVVFVIANGMIIAALLGALLLMARCDDMSRTVLSDVIFFSAVGVFLVYSLDNRTTITYEVAVFAGVLSVLSSVANSRIMVGGQR